MNRPRSYPWSTATTAVLLLAGVLQVGAAEPVRVLLLTGRSNHDWAATTPVIEEIYRADGRFAVEVTTEPEKWTPAALASVQAIVSNWSAWPAVDERAWGAAAEAAFLEFVRRGGGVVVIHAASATFRNWPEFQACVGATWGEKTGHGRIHAFQVRMADPDHPVTRGLDPFWIVDELWHRMATQPEVRPLCLAFSAAEAGGSGQDEPVLFTTRLGEGRCLNLVPGHDARTMRNPAWRALLLRATEWAATGAVTSPPPPDWPRSAAAAEVAGTDVRAAVAAAAAYAFGQDRTPLLALSRLVQGAAADAGLRHALVAALADGLVAESATPDGRVAICGQLALLADDSHVPLLARFLADPGPLGLAARGALERLPGPVAGDALRQAIAALSGPALAGVLDSLGERRETASVALAVQALASPDPTVVAAAARALGKIGGREVLLPVRRALDHADPAVREAATDALLRAADGLVAAGVATEARETYELLSDPARPARVRAAAFPGLVASRGEAGGELLLGALTSDEPVFRQAALQCLRSPAGASVSGRLTQALSSLPPPVQAAVIEALAERGDPSALGPVTAAADSAEEMVRLAALRAFGRVGSSASVPLLIRRLPTASPAETRAIRESLARIPGQAVDAALVEVLRSSQGPIRAEMIQVLGARGGAAPEAILLESLSDTDAAVRMAALRALAGAGGEATLRTLVARFAKELSDTERRETELALAGVLRRLQSAADATALTTVTAALKGATPQARASLGAVLGAIGGAEAMAPVCGLASDPDPEVRLAAIRALGAWSDATPLEELVRLAGATKDGRENALALRGVSRLAAADMAGSWSNAQRVGLLARAFAVATRTEDKRALLGAAGTLDGAWALQLATDRLTDAEVRDEAAMAALAVAARLVGSMPDEARRTVAVLRGAGVSEAALEQAALLALRFDRPPSLAAAAVATSPDDIEKDGAASGDQAAIDGNPATYWDEEDGKSLYRLRLTFPTPVTVGAIAIRGWEHHNFAPKDFDLLGDGQVLKSIRDAVYAANELIVGFPPATCTTLELAITGYYGRSPAIRELDVYDARALLTAADTTQALPPRNLALGAAASSPDGLNSDYTASGDQAAVDGDPATYWDEEDEKPLYRLRVDFPAPVTAAFLRLQGYQHQQYAPRDFDVVCDGNVVKTVKDATYANNELTLALPPTRCSSLELAITGYYGRSPAIRELAVFDSDPAVGPGPAGYSWEQTETSLALLHDGRVVWRHVHDPQQGKPYFHPLALADGTVLTCLRPADHLWHRAAWFSWKLINGLNYWEEDPNTGLSQGRTELVAVTATPSPDYSATLDLQLVYRAPAADAAVVLKEHRTVSVTAPDAAGVYRLDWCQNFTAGAAAVELARTPIPGEPGGAGHGGYAGLSLRVVQGSTAWAVVDSEGRKGLATHGQPARWAEFSLVPGPGKLAGIAMLDHPANPRHPTPWFVIVDQGAGFGYLSPALLFRRPYTLEPAAVLNLRYSLVVHPGLWEAGKVEAEWRRFAGPTGK